MRAEVKLDEQEVKSLVARHYSLNVQSLEKVRAIYRIDTPRGAFGFKNAEELADLPLVADCLHKIRTNGFPRIPGFVAADDGQYLVRYKGEAYFIEEWMEGEEVPKDSLPYLQNIGFALADFHRAAAGIEPPLDSHRHEWGKRGPFLLRACDNIRKWRQGPLCSTARDVLEFLHYRCRLAYEYMRDVPLALLRERRPESAVLCHGGLHHKNIMLDRQENIWFIDFETMTYAERVMDLAQLLQYHASPYRWDPSVVGRFLQAYVSRLARPVAREEWDLFFSYLAFPRRFHNRMTRYFDNPQRPREFLEKLQETVEQDLPKERLLRLHAPKADRV